MQSPPPELEQQPCTTCVIEPTIEKKVEDISDSNSDEIEAGFVRHYAVVKNLFSLLKMKDLICASQTCSLWTEVGEIVKNQRPFGPALLFFHRFAEEKTKALILHSNEVNVDPTVKEWILENRLELEAECEATLSRIEPILRAEVDRIEYFVEPSHLILIGTNAMDEFASMLDQPSHEGNRYPLEVFSGGLGLNISTLVAFSNNGVLYGPPNSTSSTNVVDARCEFGFMAGIVIPKRNGVKISQFAIENSTSKQDYADSQKLLNMLNIQEGDNVKGIIVFSSLASAAPMFVTHLLLNYIGCNPDVEVGGGVILNSVASVAHQLPRLKASGLVFSGNDHLEVKSICLTGSSLSEANKKLMLQFKRDGMEEEGSMAFVFCCSGRRQRNAEKTPSELTFFKENYPRTTVIGTVSEGEFYYSKPVALGPKQPRQHMPVKYTFVCVIIFVATKTRALP